MTSIFQPAEWLVRSVKDKEILREYQSARLYNVNSRQDHVWQLQSELTIFRVFNVLNSTSIAKANAFAQLVTDANSIGADVIITESWLKSKHQDDTLSKENHGFKIIWENRVKRKGGNVCVFIREELQPWRVDVHSKMENMEVLWFVVTLTIGLMMTICAIYPPKQVYDTSNFKTLIADNISCLLILFLSSLVISTNWIQPSYNYNKDWSRLSK